MRQSLFLIFITFNFLSACKNSQGKMNTERIYTEVGNASYYHDKFHGHKTASGELYDKRKYTAAHKTLPFGTIVKITKTTAKSDTIEVKINDRGPFTKNRIIDLSRVAAERIGLINDGVAEVEIFIEKQVSPTSKE